MCLFGVSFVYVMSISLFSVCAIPVVPRGIDIVVVAFAWFLYGGGDREFFCV